MAKYKAKKTFKDLDNKFFGIHKINTLIKGGSIDITDFNSLPESVKEHLEEVKPKRARTKKGTYRADDKSTKEFNEAWVGGKAPKKKKRKK